MTASACPGFGRLEGYCDNPVTGTAVLCLRCRRLRVTVAFHEQMVPPGQPDLETAGFN